MKKLIIIALVIGLISSGCKLSSGNNNRITIAGSTTVLPIAQLAAEIFMDSHKDITISIRGGGSGVGIAQLLSGNIDIADASREIKPEELQIANQKGKNITGTIIALDGIAVIVNKQNPISEIDINTLKDIYTGKINNWKIIGGLDRPIVVISRDMASGTFEVFKSKVLKGEKTFQNSLMLVSNKEIAGTVAQTPGAIGYVGIGFLTDEIKALKIDKIMPSAETVKNNTYKLARSLYMYTDSSSKQATKTFIDFVLSAQGQKIVQEAGYVPLY
jgi:phosphate transport system substrate-binding protein